MGAGAVGNSGAGGAVSGAGGAGGGAVALSCSTACVSAWSAAPTVGSIGCCAASASAGGFVAPAIMPGSKNGGVPCGLKPDEPPMVGSPVGSPKSCASEAKKFGAAAGAGGESPTPTNLTLLRVPCFTFVSATFVNLLCIREVKATRARPGERSRHRRGVCGTRSRAVTLCPFLEPVSDVLENAALPKLPH